MDNKRKIAPHWLSHKPVISVDYETQDGNAGDAKFLSIGIKKIFPQKSGGKTIVDIILDKVKNYHYGESSILLLSLLLQLMEERVVWTNLFKTKNLSQP